MATDILCIKPSSFTRVENCRFLKGNIVAVTFLCKLLDNGQGGFKFWAERTQMEKIIEYVTAKASNAEHFDKEVQKHIEDGFEPYGNPYLTDNEIEGIVGSFMMFQAMVKRAPKNGSFSSASEMSAGNPSEFAPSRLTPGKDF